MATNDTQLYRKQGQTQVVDQMGNLQNFSGNLDTLPIYNNTITPESLKPQTPLNLPSQQFDMSGADSLVSGASSANEQFQNDYNRYLDLTTNKQGDNSLQALLGDYLQASADNTGYGALQLQTEKQLGLPEKQQQRATSQGAIKTALAEYNALKAQFEGQKTQIEAGAGRKGLTTGAVMGQQGAIDRAAMATLNNKAADIGILQAQDLALAGEIEAAQKTADRAVDLLYKDRESLLATKKLQYELNKDLLEKTDAKRAKALEYAIKKEEQDTADTKAIAVEAAKNGASSEIIKAITNAKDYKEALRASGDYLATSQNEIVKLDNGSTLVVNKRTGEVVSRLGGSKGTGTTPTVIARTVAGTPVTGYTMVAGDDPYFIAQQYGTTVAELKKFNPNVKNWNNIQIGATLNVPQSTGDAYVQSLKATSGGKPLTDTSIQKLDKGLTVLNQLGVLQENVKGIKTGPITGLFKSRDPWNTQAQTIKTSLNAIVPNLARGIYGEVGVLTDNDIKTYSKTIPNLTSTEEVRNAVLYITLDMIGKSIKNTLNVNAAAGRDVSGFVDIYTEMENTKNSILSSIPNEQVPQAFQQQDSFLSQFSGQTDLNNRDFFNQFK